MTYNLRSGWGGTPKVLGIREEWSWPDNRRRFRPKLSFTFILHMGQEDMDAGTGVNR